MEKNFKNWNNIKTDINNKGLNKFYHPREVWWCSLGVNIGYEQDGNGNIYQRPVLILKGLGKNTALIIPLTTSKEKHPLRVPVGLIGDKEASAIISQIRVVDTKRFIYKICFINKEIFETIRKTVKEIL